MLNILTPLQKKDFLWLFVSQITNNCGFMLDYIVLASLLVYSWNQGPSILAVFYIAYALPMIISPFAGAFVDVLPLRKIMYISSSITAILTFIIIFSPNAFWLIFLVFIRALLKVFYYPAEMSLIKNIFDDDEYQAANSLVQFIFEVFIIFGPLLGAFLLQFFSAKHILIITGLLFCLSSGSLFFLPKRFDLLHNKYEQKTVKKILFELKEILIIFIQNKRLKIGFFSLLFVAFFYCMSESMIVIFAKEIGFASNTFEWIFIVSGGGGILGALIIGQNKNFKAFLPIILLGMGLIGLGFYISSILCPFIYSLVTTLFLLSWFLIGVGLSFVNISYNILVMKNVHKDHMGKASSVVVICWGISLLLGPSLGAELAEHISIEAPFILAGTMIMIATVYFWFIYSNRINKSD